MGIKWKKSLTFSLLTSFAIIPQLPLIVSCQKLDVKKIDGSDWGGYISGQFDPDFYTIDDENQTITYHGNSQKMGADISFNKLVIPNYVSYNDKVYCVLLGDSCFKTESFANSSNIYESVEFNDFIDEIPTECFCNQINLVELHFHIYPKSIGDRAFNDCRVNNIHVNNSVFWTTKLKQIGSYAFYECRLEGSLVFGKELEYLGSYAFYNNFNLEFVDFSFATKIKEIPSYAFQSIDSLKEVVVHKDLTTFGNSCFEDCTLLQIVTLPIEGMSLDIGAYAFEECKGFLRFSKSCKFNSIGEAAFSKDIYMEENFWEPKYGLQIIPTNAFEGISTATVSLSPDGPKEIKDTAFSDCSQLTTIDLSGFVWPDYPKWTGINIFTNASALVGRNGFILLDKSQLDEDGNQRPWIKEFFCEAGSEVWTRQGIEISPSKWIFQYK